MSLQADFEFKDISRTLESERDFVARAIVLQPLPEACQAIDGGLIELNDDVTRLHPGIVGGAAGDHFADEAGRGLGIAHDTQHRAIGGL